MTKQRPLGMDLPARHSEHREMLITGGVCPDCGSRLNSDVVCEACGLEAHRELVRVEIHEWEEDTPLQTTALMIGGPRHACTWHIPPDMAKSIRQVQVPAASTGSFFSERPFDTVNYRLCVCAFYDKFHGEQLNRWAVLTCLSDEETAVVATAAHRWSPYTPQRYGIVHNPNRCPTLHGNAIAKYAKSVFNSRVWRRISFIGVEYAIPVDNVTLLVRFSWEFLGMTDDLPDAEERYDKIIRTRVADMVSVVRQSHYCYPVETAELKPFIVLS